MYQPDDLIWPREAARLLRASQNAVNGAASRGDLGYRLKSGRLVAVKYGDLGAIKENMRGEVGNPDWIATRGKGPHSRVAAKTG